MPLNWIVAARRAVVGTESVNFTDAMSEWQSQLSEHRDTLLSWYRPLAEAESRDHTFELTFDWGIINLRYWISRAGSAVAPHSQNVIDITDYYPRLWKGPLRVLLEKREGIEDPGPQGIRRRQISIRCNGQNNNLHLSAKQEVLNRDADLLPGDVLEFPIFKLLAGSGLQLYENAYFNPSGNFFLGTSVLDADGRSPGRLRLHDNMLAMRFQLLLNAAIGAYYSLDRVYQAGWSSRTNSHQLGSERVYSRGIMYGGTLGNPVRDDRWILADSNWGRVFFPTNQSMRQGLPGNQPLTWAWSCNPSALNLAYYLCDHRGSSWARDRAVSAVNTQVESRDSSYPFNDFAEFDYMLPMRYAAGRRPAESVIEEFVRRYGGPSDAGVQWLRERALRRLLGLWPEQPDRGDIDSQQHQTRGGTDGSSQGQTFETTDDAEQAVPGVGVVDLDDVYVPEDEEGPEETEDHDQVDEDVEEPDPFIESQALPIGQRADVIEENMREFFGSVCSAIRLSAHEYSHVCVFPHSKLLEESAVERTDGTDAENCSGATTLFGPPVTGVIAAYNPLNGEPYPSDEQGSQYYFEATGKLYRTNLAAPYNFTVFTTNPFLWQRIERFRIQRGKTGGRSPVIYFGDGNQMRDWQYVISVSHLNKEGITPIYRHPREYRKISFHAADQELDNAMNQDWYTFRAVPFPTMSEAQSHSMYCSLDDVRTFLRENVHNGLGSLLSGNMRLSSQGQRIVQSAFGGQAGFEAEALAVREHRDRRRRNLQGRPGYLDERTATMERLEPQLRTRFGANIEQGIQNIRQEYQNVQAQYNITNRRHNRLVHQTQGIGTPAGAREAEVPWPRAQRLWEQRREARQERDRLLERRDNLANDPAVQYAIARDEHRFATGTTPLSECRTILYRYYTWKIQKVAFELGTPGIRNPPGRCPSRR